MFQTLRKEAFFKLVRVDAGGIVSLGAMIWT